MKCKKIFALLLSLCMIASLFVAMPISAATENVIDIDLPLDDASELTWVQSGVTVSNADGIGGRDDVVLASGVANSNNNTVGVKLPNGFAFAEGDVITFSIDVYSESAINPDMWLRNHGSALNPMAVFYNGLLETSTWTTLTRKVTFAELEAIIPTVNSSGTFATSDNYAFYLRLRDSQNANVYLDNLKFTVERPVVEKAKLVEIVVEDASDITWKNGGAAADANGIGGRDGVIELSNLANANGNTAGVKLPDGFAFKEGDILTYSFDVYSESAIHPDMWLRNHDSSLNPYATLFESAITENTWTTIAKTFTFAELEAKNAANDNPSGSFANAGNYAFYMRPRNGSVAYIDNFKVTVERPLTGEPTIETVSYVTDEGNGVYKTTTAGIVAGEQSGAWSSQVRLRIIPEVPVSTSDKLKVSFDFNAVDILDSQGNPYSEMTVNLRLYDSVGGTTQSNTIGYINNAHVAANTGAPVTVEYYIEDMVNGGGTSTATEIKSIGVQVDMYGACTQYSNVANDGYYTISNIQVGTGEKHDHLYGNWVTDGEDAHSGTCSICGSVATEAHEWDEGVVTQEPTYTTAGVKTFTCTVCDETKTEAIDKLVYRENVIDIEVADASGLTWIGSEAVTVTEADGVGGKDNVLKVEGLGNSHTTSAGIKLPDGFAFQEGDIITYSVDVYSEAAINPDIWLRNHNGSVLEPFTTFYNAALTANTWTTLTKTVEYKDFGGTGDWTTAGNFALYIRPRTNATVYLDNFSFKVSRVDYTGDPIGPEAPHEHEYVEEITTPATCEEAGVKTFTCECGDSYTEAIEALGHTWDEGVVTQEPTVDAEGVKTYTCTVCGDTYTEAIEKPPAPSVAIGDANEDGEVDVGDVTFMRQDIAGGYGVKVNETAADVNKDGTFDVGDVTHLRQFIAGGYGIVLQ